MSGNVPGPDLKKRDETAFRAAQAEIEQLRQQAAREFLADIADKYTLPVTLVVDNASTHRSKEVTKAMADLKLQGSTLYLLPPCSPELNRIEKLWQQMNYVWMGVKCRTIAVLNQDISHILDNFRAEFKLDL